MNCSRRNVAICGSMRFYDEMVSIAKHMETEMGYAVRLPEMPGETEPDPDEKRQLGEMHLRKIDASDAIYVLNINGYIGESVRREIEYAKEHGKEIIYMEEPEC